MKRLKIVLVAISVAKLTHAQNVGIGTPAPDRLLHIKGSSEVLRIQGGTPWIGFMNNTDADYKGFLYYPDTALVAGSAAGSNQPIVLAPNNSGLLYANATQRVGIGTPTPSEKLDVNGNVNVQGNLKVNGNAGRPGQVLRVNNDGSQSWANSFGYKNRKEFVNYGPLEFWTVPAGVWEIMIECVGGGGGGARGGGGGAGGYTVAIVKVSPGTVVTINICNSGNGSTSELGSGGTSLNTGSIASATGFEVAGLSGVGATTHRPGFGGGGYAVGDSVIYIRVLYGGAGTTTVENYHQLNATTYLTSRIYGNGGVCEYNQSVVSTGGFFSFNSDTNLNYRIIEGGTPSNSKGFGGGGGNTQSGGNWGLPGGFGLIAISW